MAKSLAGRRGIASCVLLLTQQDAQVWLFGGILIVVGVVLFFATRLIRSREAR